jgi:hypothetical protein
MKINDADGKTIVQVKVPVCITIQIDELDANGMTHDELAGMVDEFIDEVQSTWNATTNGVLETNLHPRGRMDRVPVRCDIARHWDELPVEDCEIMSNDAGFFDDFEGDDGW